ncbi:hypothetical protein [Alkalimarinus coralli]|uniref:hypothetical protein n=1 Tax=Alkalimarinus coralli TaxID=2935863 RepID=UPI00202B4D4C|nr:hypothetical protein [Alkalimarinus coralli]
MSATAITIIIILIILGSISLLFISQAREKARIEKIRKTNALQDRYRRVQRLINEIPPQYLNKELRVMILERGIETLSELVALKPDPTIQSNIKNDQQALKTVQESTETPKPVPIKDEATSKEVSKLLELLYRFIERQRATKKLDKSTSNKYLAYINYLISKVRADLAITKAKEAQKNGKLRVAIHNYHNAISEMMRIKDNPLAIKALTGYKAKIKQLEEAAEKEGKEGTVNPEAEKESLNKEWDDYLDKDDDWQKKNAYDD